MYGFTLVEKVVPIPNTSCPAANKDLTCIVMKYFERIMVNSLKSVSSSIAICM